ncbi:MAG: response regulator transcription factor [Campylobacterota bacterium]|nr:response regulator transcription factor [Campylobacterota bacterium]
MRSKFLKELKVLLVEDEERLSSLLKNAIGDSFYSFSVADNGVDGLQMFKESSPDIVITDIMMPKMTGLEMAKEIKRLDATMPIVILSAFSEADKFLGAIDVGVVKYFIKPFDPDELLEYIDSLEELIGFKEIKLTCGFTFNKMKKSLYKDARFVKLSKREVQLIELLVSKNIVDDKMIKITLWDEEVSDERLRTFIRRFRDKTSKGLVENVKGEGYLLR